MSNIGEFNHFLDYINDLTIKATSNANTLEELKEVERLTFGKNGIYALIQKIIVETFKNDT